MVPACCVVDVAAELLGGLSFDHHHWIVVIDVAILRVDVAYAA